MDKRILALTPNISVEYKGKDYVMDSFTIDNDGIFIKPYICNGPIEDSVVYDMIQTTI